MKRKKDKKMNQENLHEQSIEIIEQRGKKGWLMAQEAMLTREASNPRLREAIEYIMRGYKPDYFRPAVVSLCCEAVGGSVETTVPVGAFLILLGRAIGIHDDIIDKLTTRNRRQTILGRFGQDIALILSDVLSFKSFTLLKKVLETGIPQGRITKILETIDRVWFEQSEGEILEVQSRGQTDVTTEECLAKIKMRASELEATARIGGILGCSSQNKINALGSWGRSLGTSSILRDEIIDMLELKVLEHRIRNESLPLPLVYAMENAQSKSEIASLIHKNKLTIDNLTKISRLSHEGGGIDYVTGLISRMAEETASDLRKSGISNRELMILHASLRTDPEEWSMAV